MLAIKFHDTNLQPAFPDVRNDLVYFQISRMFSLFVVAIRLVICLSFYKATKRYFYVLSNRILYKTKMDSHTVEERRNYRVNQNFNEKRQEKNLVTVIESVNEVNETEHQKTSINDRLSSKNRNSKTKIYEDMISEEDYEESNHL